MKTKMIKIVPIILMLLLLPPVFEGCGNSNPDVQESSRTGGNVMEKIRERGKLVVVTDFNSTNYFIYRGQPMGYQYQLLEELADYLGLKLEVRVNNDLDANFESLEKGDIDLIAMNLTVTNLRKQKVAFTEPHTQTRQVLVQRMPANWKRLNPVQLQDSLIRNQLDLAGKEIYVQKGSIYAARLHTLANEIGGDINVVEVPIEAEQLVHMVARGEIRYTVCDENVAQVNKNYFPDLDVETAVSFPQNVAWAVSLQADDLKKEIDTWMVDFRKSSRYAVIYNKYYNNQHSVNIVNSDYYAIGSGKISQYDEAVKKESERIGWDWRLVSSMIYQESRFNPNAVSWAGAFGLMQMMPVTARRFGISQNSSPEAQIHAGTSMIKWLDKRLEDVVPDSTERVKFVLAAYNIGLGHIQDAQRLAEKYGDNPAVWDDSVEKWLLNKAEPSYYRDPVVKYGYSRGLETYAYVREVLDRYEHYRNIITPELVAQNK